MHASDLLNKHMTICICFCKELVTVTRTKKFLKKSMPSKEKLKNCNFSGALARAKITTLKKEGKVAAKKLGLWRYHRLDD